MVAAVAPLPDVIEYPSSDGKPMGETDLHIDETIAAFESLKGRYASRKDVYVASNLLIYYEEGNPAARFSPDVFVAFGVAKRRRRTYKVWAERKAPSVVIEVSSRGTWLEDLGNKKALCARLGVREYYLYDPDAEYLDPPLQGFQLKNGEYVPLRRASNGSLRSAALGLKLQLHGGRLQLVDASTGERLLRPAELHDAKREAEARAGEAEARAGEAEARAGEAEARAGEAEARAGSAAARASAEAEARRRADARAKAVEAELARLRASTGRGATKTKSKRPKRRSGS